MTQELQPQSVQPVTPQLQELRRNRWGKRDWLIVELLGCGAAIVISGIALGIGMQKSPEKYPVIWARYALPLISSTCLLITPAVIALYVIPRMEDLSDRESWRLRREVEGLVGALSQSSQSSQEAQVLRSELAVQRQQVSTLSHQVRLLGAENQKLKASSTPPKITQPTLSEASPWDGEDGNAPGNALDFLRAS